jgi:8-amino-3,8-dideoxy-alpha-D-manno-octulosonate transaminase
VSDLKAQNVLAGNFYWYDNNWHYIRKWDHLKNNTALYPLNDLQQSALKHLQSQKFSTSDAIMSRCISSAISLLWTEEQIREKGEKIITITRKVLSDHTVPIH